jgi:SAM-dependent methyltransferase
MLLIFQIILWLFVLVFFGTLVLLCFWMITAFKSKVPFITIPTALLPAIKDALMIKEGSTIYDLGCGDGRILFYLSGIIPKATYIGIENNPFPLLLVKLRSWWERKKGYNITIHNQDFFARDLTDATHIFMYLYPNVMDDLLPKFDKELKKGTRVVSASFKFTQKRPIQEIDLRRSKYKRVRMLYVYEF